MFKIRFVQKIYRDENGIEKRRQFVDQYASNEKNWILPITGFAQFKSVWSQHIQVPVLSSNDNSFRGGRFICYTHILFFG